MRRWVLLVHASVCLAGGVVHAGETVDLDAVVVTETREAKSKKQLASSVDVTPEQEIQRIAPSHPAELLNRTPGVHVNNLGGEGHMTSIRQPITTSAVYLFLEDGIPTRPTGLFNHNGLYEINMLQAERVEVTKGPGSALYGSDSIGGIINAVTKPSAETREVTLNPELGSFGWARLLTSFSAPINPDLGVRLDLNLTDSEGYRDEAEYSRYSGTVRVDGFVGDTFATKTVLSFTQVNQSGTSDLNEDDYRHDPKNNQYHGDIGYREVNALRLSSEMALEPDQYTLLTLTPFYRNNVSQMMPSWMIGYDPNVNETRFQSYGLLAKYRRNLPRFNAQLIGGVDVDYSPVQYQEKRISVTQDAQGNSVDHTETGRTNYDYDATQLSISPYVHGEWQATERLRLATGLRYDYFEVDYEDNLDGSVAEQQGWPDSFTHLRPEDQTIRFSNLSPKLSAVYALGGDHDLYANYRRSFRAPSVGSLFRSGSTTNSDELDPTIADSVELGLRGAMSEALRYEVSVYYMQVRDQVVSYIDQSSGDRKVTNAGETYHKGIELGLTGALTSEWSYQASITYTEQKYKDFVALYGWPTQAINYRGNYVSKAPKSLGNLALVYRPDYLPGSRVELEVEHVGKYYTDETNTQTYGGHNLLNLRANYTLSDGYDLYARVMNVADRRYSTYTSSQVGSSDVSYRPGSPRSVFVGLRATF